MNVVIRKGTEVEITIRSCEERGIIHGYRYKIKEVRTDVWCFPYKLEGPHLGTHGYMYFDEHELLLINQL